MQSRLVVLSASLSAVLACGEPAHVAPPTSPAPRASASAPVFEPAAGIVVKPDAKGLVVAYQAQTPGRAFHFDDDAGDIRKDTWAVRGNGLSLSSDGVDGAAPVRGFEIAIAPDSKERDRIYPALTRLGDGWLLYAPHLKLKDDSVPFLLKFEVPKDWKVVGHRDERDQLVGDGYVFIGPASYVREGAADVIAAPSTPKWLVDAIDDTAIGAVSFYTRRLGLGLRTHPTIIVSHGGQVRGGYRGDTTPAALVSLRFDGASWKERDLASMKTVADFLDHEIFHFWNGELAQPGEGKARPWLHEGGADFAALLLGRDRKEVSDDEFAAAMNRHLDRCQSAQPNLDLRAHGPTGGRGVYACGAVLEWAIDAGLRQTSKGKLDALDWWKDVLAAAQREGGSYKLDPSYALVDPAATKASKVLLDPASKGGWKAFADAMRGYGVDLVLQRLPGRDVVAALDHVLELSCGPDRGFTTFPDHVALDAGPKCGPLSGIVEVDSVAGFNPMTQSSKMNDAVRSLCRTNKAIELAWKGKTVAKAPCTKPLGPAEEGWQIRTGSKPTSPRP